MSSCKLREDDLPKCKEHPDSQVIEDFRSCERICSSCGLVLNKIVSEEAEWRRAPNAGSAGESRVGAPMNPLLQGSDLGTTTDDRKYGDDGDDEYLPSRKGGKNVRGTDRDLIFGFSLIEQLCTRFGISQNICNRASNIFKEVHKRKELFRKPSMNALAAASLYVASREAGTFLLYKQLCKNERVKSLDVARNYRVICSTLGIDLPPGVAEDYMTPFCSILKLGENVKTGALNIATKAVSRDLVPGRSPIAVAAAAIYMASQASSPGERRSSQEIADVAEISAQTLSCIYRLMYPNAEELFPADFPFDVPVEELPLK